MSIEFWTDRPTIRPPALSLQATTYKSDPPRSLTEDHYLPPATAQTVVTNDDYHQQVA